MSKWLDEQCFLSPKKVARISSLVQGFTKVIRPVGWRLKPLTCQLSHISRLLERHSDTMPQQIYHIWLSLHGLISGAKTKSACTWRNKNIVRHQWQFYKQEWQVTGGMKSVCPSYAGCSCSSTLPPPQKKKAGGSLHCWDSSSESQEAKPDSKRCLSLRAGGHYVRAFFFFHKPRS